MGKIEDVHDAEYEGDPKGNERINHAQYQPVDDDLLHSPSPVVPMILKWEYFICST
jgi:hypothetical protein